MDTMRNRYQTAGMTLMELMISVAILAAALSFAMSSMMETQKTSTILIAESNTAQEARRILAQIGDDLLDAGKATINLGPDCAESQLPPGSTCLSFTRWAVVQPLTDPLTWEEVQITYSLIYVNGEVNDGNDNNGNGLIDEMALLRKEVDVATAVTNTTTIAYNIREKDDVFSEDGGLSFLLEGNLLTIKITVQDFSPFYERPQDRLVEHSLQRSVYLRN